MAEVLDHGSDLAHGPTTRCCAKLNYVEQLDSPLLHRA